MHFLYFGHAFSTADGDKGEHCAEGGDEHKHRLKQPCLSVRHGDAAAQTGDRRGEIQAACIGRGVGGEAQQQRRALDG